ncbi:MAG TPA: AmmeMemoRadiSam system protein A, partial [Clostridia bacterium]|nr:AmmeMemoRadiSam system protein A [Clostridia bacterium]
RVSVPNDLEFCSELARQAEKLGVETVLLDQRKANLYGVNLNLDHGALVPLYFLQEIIEKVPLVHVTMGLLSREKLYAFGLAIQQTTFNLDKKLALIISGDLSHRLSEDGPYSYHPRGKEFDQWITGLIKDNDLIRIMDTDPDLCEQAGECGFNPLIILTGSLDGYDYVSRLLSYEGPFGVGYAVASFEIKGRNPNRQVYDKLLSAKKKKMAEIREKESPYVRLARESLESYVLTGKPIKLEGELPEKMKTRAGVFVSLKKDGHLRGCIGTIEPSKNNIAEEIISNAISAGVADPRFSPVREEELPEIVYSVDILQPAEPVASEAELDPQKYGVIVEKGGRRGLLLPNLPGIESVEEQIRIAKQKAGIGEWEKVKLYRFQVERYY